MQTLPEIRKPTNPPAAKQPSLLPPSMQQEIELSSAGDWNLEQAKERLAPPECQALLRTEMARLESLLSPAKPQEIMICLGRLMLHYPMANMSEHEKTMLLEDYIDDLSRYPAWAIVEVCREYRRDEKNQFFPKVSILANMAARAIAEHAKARKSIAIILADDSSKKRPEPVAELMASLTTPPSKRIETAPAISREQRVANTVAAMREAGRPEEDILEFENSMRMP